MYVNCCFRLHQSSHSSPVKIVSNSFLLEHCTLSLPNAAASWSHEQTPTELSWSFSSSQRDCLTIWPLIFCHIFKCLKKRAHCAGVKPHSSRSCFVTTSATCAFITWCNVNALIGKLAWFNREENPTSNSSSTCGGTDFVCMSVGIACFGVLFDCVVVCRCGCLFIYHVRTNLAY